MMVKIYRAIVLAVTLNMMGLPLVANPIAMANDLENVPEIDAETGARLATVSTADVSNKEAKPSKAITALEQPSFDQPHEPSFEGAESEESSSHETSTSGFYLRGSLGGSLDVGSEFTPLNGATFSRRIGNAFQATGSLGYAFNDILRLEGEVGYLGNLEAKNLLGQDQNLEGVVFGANIFADLGTVVGFTPYVGGGIGGVKFKDSQTRLRFNAQAGIAYKLSEQLSLELGYEYSRIKEGDFNVNGIEFRQDDFDSHMIKIGTRFKF